MSKSISNLALFAPSPNHPLRSKGCIPFCLFPMDLRNPSPWITCQDCFQPSIAMSVCLWSWIASLNWPFCQLARNVSLPKPLLNSSLNASGYVSGCPRLSFQIVIVGSSAHFGPASGRCWIPSSPSPQLSIPKQMARQRSSTE